jgi:hypothetical protein
MRRVCVLLGVVSALAGVAPPALAAETAPLQTQATVPPALQTLEQKMEQLQVNSERFSLVFEIEGAGKLGKLFGAGHGGTQSIPFLTASGEASISPSEAVLNLSFLGIASTMRLIGETEYLFEPALARYDGGRPWIRSDPRERKQTGRGQTLALSPASLFEVTPKSTHKEQPVGGATGPFARTIELVNHAQNVQEVGPTTVDGQAVTEFTATIDRQALAGGVIGGGTRKTSKGSANMSPKPSGKPKPRMGGKPRMRKLRVRKLRLLPTKLELFIAPSGVPVRTNIVTGRHGSAATITTDILAINIPVVVQPPPVNATISLAQFRTLLRKREQAVRMRACLGNRCSTRSRKMASRRSH